MRRSLRGKSKGSKGLAMKTKELNRVAFRMMAVVMLLMSIGSADAAVTPADAPLTEDGITRVTCMYSGEPVNAGVGLAFKPPRGEFHYDLYLPPGYNSDPKERFPCLFIASAGGNASLGAMAAQVKQRRFIAVMLIESKNGAWEPPLANFCAAHDDAVKRVRIADGFKFTTGQSGGARASAMFMGLRTGFAGVFLQSAGFAQGTGGTYVMQCLQENPNMGVFATFGNKDFNLKEAGLLAEQLPPRVPYHYVVFSGGHQWAPEAQVDEAFDWLEQWTYFGSPAGTTAVAKAMYLSYLHHLVQRSDEAATDFDKYEWMDKAQRFAASHHLATEKSLAPVLAGYHKKLLELAKQPAIKKEIAARDAYFKLYTAEETARRQNGKNATQLKPLLMQASKAYQAMADKYPDTAYSAKAKAAVERLAMEAGE